MIRIPFSELHAALSRVLQSIGFEAERASQSARLFAEASRDGVASHGLNRFPRFISYIQKGYIDIHATPRQTGKIGAMEQWDGQLGPGNLNAWFCMDRAIELAKANGMGLVALRNTNHWMRGGTYGWQAADAGMIGICFTNTQPNMPPWGAKVATLGNNPLIIALPRPEGHIVLDTAMTQFSFGKLETYRRQEKKLPIPGGFDTAGNLTDDPGAIEESWRPLPFGYWKGSGLSLALDLVASALAGGMCTTQIGKQGPDEYGLSQILLAIDPLAMGSQAHYQQIVTQTLDALHAAEADESGGGSPTYPGERTLQTRLDSQANGIPVDAQIWANIQAMQA